MDPVLAIEAVAKARLRRIDETTARGDSSVQQFYEGAVVLVTGGSGFIGKQLIEKLLRSCNISKIYMLLRIKGNNVQQRMGNFVKDPVFETLRAVKPDFVTKIYPIVGDVTQVGLGITHEDRDLLINEVTVIFHGAATVSFTEPLKLATMTNVRGACEMLLLGRACKKLKAYVHISTAYSHATEDLHNKTVREKFYDSPISPSALIEMAENFDEKILDNLTPALIKNWPNTYSFTKAVAEEAVRTMSGQMPVCIVRPAVVICSLREPAPGWIDSSNVNGPSGLIIGIGLGALHAIFLKSDTCLDFVPVDIVNNATIVAAKKTADMKKHQDDVRIYTVTGCKNPIPIGNFVKIMHSNAHKYNSYSYKQLWSIFVFMPSNKIVFMLMHWLFHLIPAHVADVILYMLGKRPVAVKLCNRFLKISLVYSYFVHKHWAFDDTNLIEAYYSLSPADRLIFGCNTTDVQWKLYIHFYSLGLRKYILKDDLKKKTGKAFWLNIANIFVLPVYLFVIVSIFVCITMCAFKTVMFVVNLIY